MWEIMTDGETPYAHLSNQEVVDSLQAGERLEKPKQCGDSLYQVMNLCWNVESANRPTFEEICEKLNKFESLPDLPQTTLKAQQSLYFNQNGHD